METKITYDVLHLSDITSLAKKPSVHLEYSLERRFFLSYLPFVFSGQQFMKTMFTDPNNFQFGSILNLFPAAIFSLMRMSARGSGARKINIDKRGKKQNSSFYSSLLVKASRTLGSLTQLWLCLWLGKKYFRL
jgi:hypothetical protein